MKMAIFALRMAASFANQSALICKAAIHEGWEVDERDISERARFPKEHWDRMITVVPLWPRYIYDCVRLAMPWMSQSFILYGPVDGPFTLNVNFFKVIQNTIRQERIAVPSQFCKDMLAKSGIHCGPVVRHGIDPGDFKFSKSKKYDRLNTLRAQHPDRTIFFSNLNPLARKGFPQLAKATEILAAKRPKDFTVILHTGLKKALQIYPGLEKVPNLVLEDAYNQLPYRQIALKTVSCDVLVHPSLNEGFGLTILEAMAAKKTIVCVDAPAMNELVSEKEAYLVPITGVKEVKYHPGGCMAQLHEYTPESLALVMEYAMDNPKESREKANRAHKKSKQYHYRKVYKPLVKK